MGIRTINMSKKITRVSDKIEEEIYAHYLIKGEPLKYYAKQYNLDQTTISWIITKNLFKKKNKLAIIK